MNQRELWVVDAGLVPYAQGVALQEAVHRARRAGTVPDTLLLLEHPPVITLGRGADQGNLLVDRESLAARGVEVHETARGGDVTYHGPGQLVGYPIFDLNDHGRDVHRFLRSIEVSLIHALASWGLTGERVPGLTGVWVGWEKVAAIGIGVRQWVTWHGFALNVNNSLDAFSLIVPCGIRDRGVTSLQALLARDVPLDEASAAVVAGFAAEFNSTPVEVTLAYLRANL